ncbi:hypothetical protein ACFWAT_14335 [Streptomyces syringium]|uniref:hypothetical protein n=1 Tax=Streptomyces syringium TaxID=76729 RepID=UPI00365614A5
MIKPQRVTVTRYGRRLAHRRFWIHFDTAVMVELKPELARELAYELASYVGLAVSPAEHRTTRLGRRLRTLVRRAPARGSWRSAHARR